MAGISVEATPVRRCGHDSCGHNFCGAAPRPTPKFFSAFGDTDGEFFAQIFSLGGRGGGAVFFISKNLPLKGKFFEMVSWGGLRGRSPSQEVPSPMPCSQGGLGMEPPSGTSVTHALPPQRPCLAPHFFFVRPNFFRLNFFRPSVVRRRGA